MKKITLLCFCALILSSCLPKNPYERYYKMAEYFSDYVIDANEIQEQQLKQIVTSGLQFQQNLVPINRSIYDEVTNALKNGRLDEQKLEDLIRQRYLLQAQMINNEMTKIAQILASLNEKQRKQALENLEEYKEDSLWFQFALGQLDKKI